MTSQLLADIMETCSDEEKTYDYGNPGFSMDTGHFTQTVWVGTTDLGCHLRICALNGGQMYAGYGSDNS